MGSFSGTEEQGVRHRGTPSPAPRSKAFLGAEQNKKVRHLKISLFLSRELSPGNVLTDKCPGKSMAEYYFSAGMSACAGQ